MIVLKVILYAVLALLAVVVLYFAFLEVLALLVDPNKEYNTHSRFYRNILNFSTGVVFWLGRVHFEVSGMEKVPADGRFLLVSNHKSNFDPLACWYIFRKYDIAFISKPANFKIPFFGRMIRKCCFMAIDRENARNALETIHRAVTLLDHDVVSIGAYPEGTRNKAPGYDLLPFRPGLLKIAQKAKVPIVVISMKGTPDIRYFFRRNTVRLHVLETIPVEEVTACTTNALTDRIAAEMAADLSH